MKFFDHLCLVILYLLVYHHTDAQLTKGALLYDNPLDSKEHMSDWIMEGPGSMEYKDGWMQLFSPAEKGHHVLWCPKEFPSDFVAEWEAKNLHPEAGLCIVFFSAKGLHEEDIFAPSEPHRNGNFKQYTDGAMRNYHISYYANAKNEPDRETANLRKNPGFHKVQTGEAGVPSDTAGHHIQLVKQDGHIQMFIDGRKIIDWQETGTIWGAGLMGFRQMKWTRFAYRDFKVWALPSTR